MKKIWNSILFVPVQERRLKNAENILADAYIFDLEDAVKEEAKEKALYTLGTFLSEFSPQGAVLVRLNSRYARKELEYLQKYCDFDGVVLPKVENKEQLDKINDLIKEKYVLALIETAMGMIHIEEIVGEKVVDGIAFGAEDYCVETGMEKNSDLLLALRTRMIMYATAYKKHVFDMVDVNYTDLEKYKEEVCLAKRLGFHGKMAIHPAQIDIIREVYNNYDLSVMKEIVEAYKNNSEGFLMYRGKAYEKPHIEQLERKIQELEMEET